MIQSGHKRSTDTHGATADLVAPPIVVPFEAYHPFCTVPIALAISRDSRISEAPFEADHVTAGDGFEYFRRIQ